MTQLGEIGAAVRALRRDRDWTQARLAREIGTDPVTVSRWERGVSHPRPSLRRQLRWLGLADGPRSSVPFKQDPATRIRELDRALLEQLHFKSRVRLRR